MIEVVGEQFWPAISHSCVTGCCRADWPASRPSRSRTSFSKLTGVRSTSSNATSFQAAWLPSPAVLKSLGDSFGVPVIRERIFGQDYANTLASWRNNFRAAWPGLVPLGFNDRFGRLSEYYLAYCEAGFLSGNIDVLQVIFAKQQ